MTEQSETKQKRWERTKYEWESLMNAGDSFEIPEAKRNTGRQLVYAKNKAIDPEKPTFKFESGSGKVVKL